MANLRTPTLVIDDDAAMRRTLRSMLRKIGFSDITEDDGTEALATMRSRAFGLVLCDLRMQPKSGLELLELVRGEPELAATPFIMVTAASEARFVKTALELGVDGYLVKPFTVQTLQRKVFRVLDLATA